MTTNWGLSEKGAGPEADRPAASGDCWRRIGVGGDRSCPELNVFIHCRNCPVFADAARSFFDRPAPEGYLAEWSRWLAEAEDLGRSGEAEGTPREDPGEIQDQREGVSVLIFRLGGEWLAWPTRAVVEVTTPRPVHRVPHRSNRVLTGLVNLHGQAQLCVSLHGLLGVDTPAASRRLVVVRDRERAETWAFGADEVLGVHRVPRSHWHSVPSTLINPAVGFSQAVLSWNGRRVGLLDEQRVFAVLRDFPP
jgi:chemotaxis-related protein WspD